MAKYEPKFSITNKALNHLTEIVRSQGFLDAATLSEDWIRRMSERALLLEAHHTTHIEGTQLTIEQSAELWAGREIGVDKDDIKELLNYRNAFQFISDYIESGYPVTEGMIREIHKRLVAGVRGDRACPGEWRSIQNCVANSQTGEVIYMPPPPADVPVLMREFVEWVNDPQDLNPIVLAGIAQYKLVHIHPFVDGNGRTSRLLSTLLLYRAGYNFKRLFTLSEFYDRDRRAFYSAIRSVEQTGGDLSLWIEYFITGLSTQLKEVKLRGEQAITASLISAEQGLGSRGSDLISEFLHKKELTPQEIKKALPDMNQRTIQRDLKKMEKKGLIKIIGRTNDRRFQWIFEEK